VGFHDLKAGMNLAADAVVEAHESYKVTNGTASGKNLFWAAECRQKNCYISKFKLRTAITGDPTKCTLRKLGIVYSGHRMPLPIAIISELAFVDM
jgi:hypothetical protein